MHGYVGAGILTSLVSLSVNVIYVLDVVLNSVDGLRCVALLCHAHFLEVSLLSAVVACCTSCFASAGAWNLFTAIPAYLDGPTFAVIPVLKMWLYFACSPSFLDGIYGG